MHKPIPILFIATCSIGLMLFSITSLRAQNLVPNPSFEDHLVCPNVWGQITSATPWWRATNGSPDYFHRCGTNGWSVPGHGFGFQEPHSGDAYAGEVFLYWGPLTYREYIYVPLTEALQGGVPYEVGFWISLSDEYSDCPCSEFGGYFSVESPPFGGGSYQGPLDFLEPQFKPEPGFVSDTQNWTLLTGCVVFDGGEQYMTIGNFSTLGEHPYHPDCGEWDEGVAYYLIDDVFVIPKTVEELEIELGDTITVCDEYHIDPGIPGVNYYWSTGSTDPDITVSEAGYYSVTITQGCEFGRDSVYVHIPNAPPVDLGPYETELCVSETLTIVLDPAYDYTWQDGSTDPTYTITEPGLYQVTMNDGCNVSMDEMFVALIEPPAPFSITDHPYLCEGEDLILSMDPLLGDFLWSTGSTNNYLVVTAPGDYSLTITNMCGSAANGVDVVELAAPAVDLGPDTFFCDIQSLTISLPFDPQHHLFEWSDESELPEFTITTEGVYAVTVINACGDDSDSIAVAFLAPPAFSLGPDTLLCSLGQGFLLSPGNFAGSVFMWQDSTTTNEYLVTTPGQYALTVSNPCGTDDDAVIIDTIPGILPFDLGPDISLCSGDSIVLSLSLPGAQYLWQDSSVNDSFVVKADGQYHVTAFNTCSAQADTIQVSFTATAPDVDLPDPVTLCRGQSIQVESGISGVNYMWSDNSTGPSILVSNAGTYSLTVSNNCGTDTDSVIIIDGGPAPFVELGSDVALCSGDTIDVAPAFSDVNTWLWSTGATSSSIEITTGGTTSVIVSNSCGTQYDTINATLLPAIPTFSLGNDTAVCANEVVPLFINIPNVNIMWSDGSTDPGLVVNNAGQYFAIITNACGSFADTISISQLPPIPPLDLGDDQSLCPGELFIIDPGITDVDYLWHDGTTASTFSTTQPGTFALTITNACGSDSDQLIITENTDGPHLDLGPDIFGCVGESVTIPSGISGVDYVWHDGSTGSSINISASGQVILSVSNNCGTDADTLLVDLSGLPPMVDLGADTLLCDDATINLQVNVLPGTDLLWQDGSSSSSFQVHAAGQYTVAAVNACGETNDSILVAYEFSPQPFSLGPDTALCIGESLILTAPVTADLIQWQDGSSSPTLIADQTQVYALQISNQCGVVSDELQLTMLDESFSIDLDPISWCPQEEIVVNAEQSFPATYQWSTGAATPAITITSPGTYSLSIQTQCATVEDAFEVSLADDCFPKVTYYIPNIFSPNGDGINDFFTVQFNADAEVLAMEGTIYDRWGNVLFASNDIPFTWNGKRNDQLMNPAVFVYVLEFTFMRNGVPTMEKVTGDLTLIR